MCWVNRPFRGETRSSRARADLGYGAVPVGAGKPAKGPKWSTLIQRLVQFARNLGNAQVVTPQTNAVTRFQLHQRKFAFVPVQMRQQGTWPRVDHTCILKHIDHLSLEFLTLPAGCGIHDEGGSWLDIESLNLQHNPSAPLLAKISGSVVYP